MKMVKPRYSLQYGDWGGGKEQNVYAKIIIIFFLLERLHEELSENRHIYTEHVNGLHLQIKNFEKRIEELEVERSTMQKDRRDQATGLKQEITTLQIEVNNLKKELAE